MRAAALAVAAVALAGCGAHAKPPAAPIARAIPAGYHAKHVWHADLTAAAVDDVIVASAGPAITSLDDLHSADLRVLSWDALAARWYVSFDAQKLNAKGHSSTVHGNEYG